MRTQHCIGHMLGLARTTPSPHASWILMAGDAAHHPAMLRPAPYLPLPGKEGSVHHDHERAARTHEVVRALDARDDVWVVLSHDGSVDVGDSGVRWMPEEANAWRAEGVKERTRWRWLEKGNPAYRW